MMIDFMQWSILPFGFCFSFACLFQPTFPVFGLLIIVLSTENQWQVRENTAGYNSYYNWMAFHRVNKDCPAPQDKMVHLVPWLVCGISLSQFLPMLLELESLEGVLDHLWPSGARSALFLQSGYSRPLPLYWTYTENTTYRTHTKSGLSP